MIRDCELWWLKKLVEGVLKGFSVMKNEAILRQINVCRKVGCTDKEIEDTISEALIKESK
jgi:hypothetical protein